MYTSAMFCASALFSVHTVFSFYGSAPAQIKVNPGLNNQDFHFSPIYWHFEFVLTTYLVYTLYTCLDTLYKSYVRCTWFTPACVLKVHKDPFKCIYKGKCFMYTAMCPCTSKFVLICHLLFLKYLVDDETRWKVSFLQNLGVRYK